MDPHRQLTFRSVNARPMLVPLSRPVVSRVGHCDLWPLILIDLQTEEGIVGRSYLEPYLKDAARYIGRCRSPRRLALRWYCASWPIYV